MENQYQENTPLALRLKGIDATHPYLGERGISKELAEEFGVGFFSGKGSMHGRIVIPIHNESGHLIAYAGRSVDGTEPKYELTARFDKSLVLYNLHRALRDPRKEEVVIVEGIFGCLKVYQTGLPCVALMGCSMSEQQEELLAKCFLLAWVLFDGDEAGRSAAAQCVGRLMRRMFVKVVVLPDGRQPDQLRIEELRGLL